MTMTGDDGQETVVYVTIDSIRADSVGFLGAEATNTPTLDALAADGTTVHRAIANGIPTYYSFKSLLGGVHSLSHSRTIGLPDTVTSLAEGFADAGYATAGFNASNPWLTTRYGYDRGFDTFEDFMGGGESGAGVGRITRKGKRVAKRAVGFSDALTDTLGRWGRIANALVGSQPLTPAEPVTDAAIEWLAATDDRPQFLWIHYMDPHYPWVPPAEYLDEDVRGTLSRVDVGRIWHTVAYEYQKDTASIDPETLERIEQLYAAEVRRTDAAIGRLLDAMKARGIFEDALVTVVGDHGTELNDHGGFSHGPRTLYDEVIRVPLVFHGPTVPTDSVELGGLVDVPATIVDAVGGVEPPDTFEGVSLFEESRDGVCSEVVYDIDPARSEGGDNGLLQSRVAPPWKLIRNQHTGASELYNLADDPSEQSPVSADEAVRADLETGLDKHRAAIERRNRTVAERTRIRRRVAELRAAGKV
jgi:arylsulfatase A-like enzyme